MEWTHTGDFLLFEEPKKTEKIIIKQTKINTCTKLVYKTSPNTLLIMSFTVAYFSRHLGR